MILAFAKKFFVLILVGIGVIGAWINRRFLGGGTQETYSENYYEEASSDEAAYPEPQPIERDVAPSPGEQKPEAT